MLRMLRSRLIIFTYISLRRMGMRLIGASLTLMGRKGPTRRLALPCARLSGLLMRMAFLMERGGWVDVQRFMDGRFSVEA